MMKAKILSAGLVLAIVLAMALPAWALDIEAESRVSHVRLLAGQAEVTRQVAIDVPAGDHQIIIAGLPERIDPSSLRLSLGESDSSLSLGAISLTTRPLAGRSDQRAQELLDRIEALQNQQTGEQDKIAAQEAKLTFIKGLSQGLGQDQALEIRRGAIDGEGLTRLFDLVRDQSQEALTSITQARIEVKELGREIERLQRALDQLDSGQIAERIATIPLRAEADGQAEFALTYQVTGGSWRPLIEARLDTQTGALLLQQMAIVTQRTGEDWRGITLELSTSRPVSGALPKLESWAVDIVEPPAVYQGVPTARLQERSFAPKAEVLADAAIIRPDAEFVQNGLDVHFIADGLVDVPSGGGEHQVWIGELPQTAEIGWRAQPSIAQEARLLARFVLQAPARLPASEIRLFRDDGFVGVIQGALMNPGEPVEMEFGRDEAVAIEYRLDRDGRSAEGIINNFRRLTRAFETTVSNAHKKPIAIEILDRQPVARDERIEIELSPSATPPDRVEVDGRDGVVAWDLELAPGESRTLSFGYSVTYPDELEISNF